MDFAAMSLLLIAAQFLRSKVKFLQRFYIPASVLAGIMGLIPGPQVLGVIRWSDKIGSYAYLLICVVFAGLYLGKTEKASIKTVFRNVGDTFCMNMGTEFVCFGAALNNLLGREDCVQIGQTFATLGLLTGLFGGIACINWAARHGATRLVKQANALPEDCLTGIIPPEKQSSMGKETINPMSMDPLAWHMALTLLAFFIGYKFYYWYKQYLPNIELPMMCLTMIAGVIIQTVLNHTKFRDSVDKHVEDRIGSMATDYLVGFGVASISITVVKSFIGPIAVLCVLGTIWPLFMVFWLGRRLYHNFWFERSIFIFGWCTGVVAIGVTLLRICDPEMKSGTLDDYGTAYTVISVIEVFLVALAPQLAVSMGCTLPGAIFLAIGIGLFFTCAKVYGVHKGKMSDLREGEAEIING